MLRSRLQYLLTWIALAVLLAGGILLLVFSWNSFFPEPVTPIFMILIWICISASGIFLFIIAIKKASGLPVEKEQNLQIRSNEKIVERRHNKEESRDRGKFDFAASARKLVRRTPDHTPMEEVGKVILKNLARELEIMSGVFYIRKKDGYESISSYALSSPEEPYAFKEGEGLTGQVARNQQLMVLTRFPEGYIEVFSGLGKSQPEYLAIVPLVYRNRTVALLECSGYRYDPHEVENMFRIFSRDIMKKIAPGIDGKV